MTGFALNDRVRLTDPADLNHYLIGTLVDSRRVPGFLNVKSDPTVFGLRVENVDVRDLDGHPFPITRSEINDGLVTLEARR